MYGPADSRRRPAWVVASCHSGLLPEGHAQVMSTRYASCVSAGESPQPHGAAATSAATVADGEAAPAAETAKGGETAAGDAVTATSSPAQAGARPQVPGQGGTPVRNGRSGGNGRERRPKVDVQRLAEVRQASVASVIEKPCMTLSPVGDATTVNACQMAQQIRSSLCTGLLYRTRSRRYSGPRSVWTARSWHLTPRR
jgi:hypothetical protein